MRFTALRLIHTCTVRVEKTTLIGFGAWPLYQWGLHWREELCARSSHSSHQRKSDKPCPHPPQFRSPHLVVEKMLIEVDRKDWRAAPPNRLSVSRRVVRRTPMLWEACRAAFPCTRCASRRTSRTAVVVPGERYREIGEGRWICHVDPTVSESRDQSRSGSLFSHPTKLIYTGLGSR